MPNEKGRPLETDAPSDPSLVRASGQGGETTQPPAPVYHKAPYMRSLLEPALYRLALEEGIQKLYGADRPDWGRAHVSDLKNCPRQVYARMRGLETLSTSSSDLVKYQMGHAMERVLVDSLATGLAKDGWVVATDVVCWFVVHKGSIECGRLDKLAYLNGELIPMEQAIPFAVREKIAHREVMVGHADALAARGALHAFDPAASERILWECKSEVWRQEQKEDGAWRPAAPAEPWDSYLLQGHLYAAALNAHAHGYLVGDRASGGFVTFGPYRALTPRELYERYGEDVRRVIRLAREDRQPPPGDPPVEFGVDIIQRADKSLHVRYRACARCRFAVCERNENPAKLRDDLVAPGEVPF